MGDFNINLKRLRKQKGLTQEDLAQKLGVRKTTISNYESGYSTPPFATLERLAQILDTSVDIILGKPAAVHEAKLQESEQAVIKVYYSGAKDLVSDTVSIPRPLLGEGDFFLIQLGDNALESLHLHQGDLVLCQKQSSVSDGELAAVTVKEKGRLVRYLSQKQGKITLVSSDKIPPEQYEKSEVTILGKAVKALTRLSD